MCGRWLAMSQDEDTESYWSIGQKHYSKTMNDHDELIIYYDAHVRTWNGSKLSPKVLRSKIF